MTFGFYANFPLPKMGSIHPLSSPQNYQWNVSLEESGLSLLQYVSKQLPSFSSKFLKKCIDKGFCTINQIPERFSSSRIHSGDRISLSISPLPQTKAPSFSILYRDSICFAINKPSGISLEQLLLIDSLQNALPVHRLDKDTSGVLLLTHTEEAKKQFEILFRKREIKKEYLAIVDGVPSTSQGMISSFLIPHKKYQGQTIWKSLSSEHPTDPSHYAQTSWKLLDHSKKESLLLCTPKTGRTHQIRVHLSECGHPILGDMQYGKHIRSSYFAPHHLLHAWKLSFFHPVTKKYIELTAPLPEFLQKSISTLFPHISCAF